MILETFSTPMTALGRERTIRVLVPARVPRRRYPVVYMHDGQNLFRDDQATFGTCWSVEEALDALGLGLIVVGIDSNPLGHGRLDELSPWANDWIRHKSDTIDQVVGGEGEAYFDFVVNELKPRIDATYPTEPGRESTFVAGSSMGGLASLYGACRHPSVFSRVACFSSAFWFAAGPLATFLETAELPDRVYLDVGTREGSRRHDEEERQDYIRDTQSIGALLARRGLGPDRLKVVIDEGGRHNEAAWARRLPVAWRWWLKD